MNTFRLQHEIEHRLADLDREIVRRSRVRLGRRARADAARLAQSRTDAPTPTALACPSAPAPLRRGPPAAACPACVAG